MTIKAFIQHSKDFFNSDLGTVLLFLGLIVATFIGASLFRRFYKRTILDSQLSPNDPTNYQFFQHTISALIYVAGFSTAMYMIPNLRSLSTSVLAGAGIFAVAIGFASQAAFSNIISGLFIVIFKPFRVNDRVSIGTQIAGVVEDITLRHTVVRSYENRRFVIPNSHISEQVIVNSDLTDQRICKFILFKVGYDADLSLAMKIIEEEATKHELTLDQRTEEQIENQEPIVPVRVTEWSDFAIILRASVWANDSADAFTITCDLNKVIKERFDEAGIKIPVGLKLNNN